MAFLNRRVCLLLTVRCRALLQLLDKAFQWSSIGTLFCVAGQRHGSHDHGARSGAVGVYGSVGESKTPSGLTERRHVIAATFPIR